jgi:hypothetical protein
MVALWQSILLAHAFCASLVSASSTEVSINPIRKVVNLLQAMQKKVSEEGEKSEALYKKYMCYCKTSGSDLAASISAAEVKIPELAASIKAASSRKVQAEEDLKSHQTDRSAAQKSMAEATALRAKEKAAFDKLSNENQVNLAAMKKAVAAISGGMGGSFLQSAGAGALRSLVEANRNMASGDRQDLLAFLSGEQRGQYAPASGEIVGILKNMVDEMTGDQKDVVETEEAAIKAYTELMAAKKKEVAALTVSIETKMARIGDLGVEIATMKNDAGDTADSLASDQKFTADLKSNCASKTGIHEEEKAERAAEVVALADTIKILNDDDALELFKKTLPSASSSLIQVQRESNAAMRIRARAALTAVKKSERVDFILLALRGSKVGFAKIVTLIDELVVTLKKEQDDDDHKKEYCAVQFDGADDKKKLLERSVSDLEAVLEESKEGVATLTQEIKDLTASVTALDKAVADATEQRKAENVDYKDLMTSNTAAKELILFAKNRLNKFYNPALHKAAPERELSEGDRIYVNEGGDIPTVAPGGIANTGIAAFVQLKHEVVPAPPPATAAAYTKKSGESGGVMAMMDLLVQDLDKEMTTAETEEKNGKAEYESTMADSADKRRQDSKTLTDKVAAKADLEGSIEVSTQEKKNTVKELMGTTKYIASLHAECDWLLQYFDVRKQARSDEIDSLGKAKAVLSGADYSLVQRDSPRARKFLQQQ